MGIDLEQPSGEYYKEDSRSHVNINMVNGDDEVHNRGGAIVNSGNNKENNGPNVKGTLVDGRQKLYAGDGINLNSVKNVEPHEGMEFESKEEAFSFYKEYAKYGNKREPSTAENTEAVLDTDIMKNVPVKKKRGRINRSWSKTDCKACMHVKRRHEDGRWIIRSFIKEHNHEIFPDQAYYFRGHRNLDLGNSNVDALHAIRDRTKRMFVTMSKKSGGHVMIVLQMFGVHSIPSQYILTRWTKDAKSRQTRTELSDVDKSRVQRYNDLCRLAFKLGDEGSLSQESYNIVFSALEEALRKCESVNNSIQSVMESTSPSIQGPQDCEEVNQGDNTLKTNKKDSISKKKQVHPETEVITIGIHDSWQQMGHSNLRAPALDCSYEMQERIQGMEQLNSRAPTLDGYFGTQQIVQGMAQINSMTGSRDDFYGNQHNMQGLGQLNSIAPIHDAHYITQQRMHGMGQLHFRSHTIPNCFDIQDSLQDMDQSNAGPSQLHGMPSKHLHSKHLNR
ncbi:hypothetical protein Pint_12118 [Pistacia integerrima]|uniref:Uncharacterized protein n=1 Tax=Pistacia integerrima TaxID=434235 RepID=A0ACC0XHN6_9ROSI|nr:hypothetical protein Pint_12118 [Pistacia integerrima]